MAGRIQQTTDLLRCFQNFVRLNACSTNGHTLCPSVHLSANFLQIGEPSTTRFVVRVADVVAANRPLPTNVAYFCHILPWLKLNVAQYMDFPLAVQTKLWRRRSSCPAALMGSLKFIPQILTVIVRFTVLIDRLLYDCTWDRNIMR